MVVYEKHITKDRVSLKFDSDIGKVTYYLIMDNYVDCITEVVYASIPSIKFTFSYFERIKLCRFHNLPKPVNLIIYYTSEQLDIENKISKLFE